MKEQGQALGRTVSGSRLDLPAIKKLCEAASPGPWKLDSRWPNDVLSYGSNTICRLKHPYDDSMLKGNVANDQNFIAAARTLVPQLVEALEEALKLLRRVVETRGCPYCGWAAGRHPQKDCPYRAALAPEEAHPG